MSSFGWLDVRGGGLFNAGRTRQQGLRVRASRVRYGVVGFALSLAILSYVQRVAISQAAGPISAELDLDKAELGAVLGAFGLAYAAFELPMGLLGDKFGVRRVLTRIVLAWSFFTALTGAWLTSALWLLVR